MSTPVQIPSLILPTSWVLGTETETIDDALEHTSTEFQCTYLQEKQVVVLAIEAVAVGVPGNLWCWVELSPLPSTATAIWPASTIHWAAIGGGGGAQPPMAPAVIVGTGVNLTQHTLILPWTAHSPWGRVVVQTPVVVATAVWAVQVIIMGASK